MIKDELIKQQKIEHLGKSYIETLSVYLDIVEHYIFIGNLKKATTIMRNLGFKEKNCRSFIKTIIKKYDDDDSKYLKMIMNNQIKRKLLN
tara:strand:+ start:430 stop:699 length:270 start_codon:yes stop_codon:yes gene_type:complete